jgi:two-component system phosphate regulon sensor histidine kinase PhoR
MDRRRGAWLLVVISIALVGLVAIQVVWIRNTIALKEAQFTQGVNNALYAVSERLERLERFQRMTSHRAGRRLLSRLDSLRQENVRNDLSRTLQGDLGVSSEVALPHDAFDDSSALQRSLSSTYNAEEHEAMVADVVRGLLLADPALDLRERIDQHRLDSLLIAEFEANDLPIPVRYGIYDAQARPALVVVPPEADSTALQRTPYRERLFHHDLSGQTYYLHVLLPDQHAALLRGLAPMLLAATLFVAIIVLGFLFTLRTIYRQRRLSDIRSDLVNNMTHELKTPISTIGLACEALSDPSMPKTEAQVRTFVGMIREENKRLGVLVESVLQSAVLESGNMAIKPVQLDVHQVIREAVLGSNMQVSRRNGNIELSLDAELHQVEADRIHLTNLLYNLIDNAVKYTEQEPRIRISTKSNDEGLTITVSDNGVGIPSSEQRKVFERLYRVPTGNIHNAKGFGLGLSYVKAVVDRHGGRIRLESTPGQGSTFHIFLPFEHVPTDTTSVGRG